MRKYRRRTLTQSAQREIRDGGYFLSRIFAEFCLCAEGRRGYFSSTALLVGVVSGIAPAVKAARLNPVEVINR
jgi:hypothetical protein